MSDRKTYLEKNRGCEVELHERLEKKLPNFWNGDRKCMDRKPKSTWVHSGSLYEDRAALLFYCKAQLGKQSESQSDKERPLLKGKTHGSLGQRECCSTGRESVGAVRSHPKCWGTCRERLQSWRSPPMTRCDKTRISVYAALSSGPSRCCLQTCLCCPGWHKPWIMDSFRRGHHIQ